MGESPKDAAIVGAILAFGHAVGVEITAEGVETSEQGDRLRRLGCALAQGYLFGRPVSAADLTSAIVAVGGAARIGTTSNAPIAIWAARGSSSRGRPAESTAPDVDSVVKSTGGARAARSHPA